MQFSIEGLVQLKQGKGLLMYEEAALRVNEGLNALAIGLDSQSEEELTELMERIRDLIHVSPGMAERTLTGWLREVTT